MNAAADVTPIDIMNAVVAVLALLVALGAATTGWLSRRDNIRTQLKLEIRLGVDTKSDANHWPVVIKIRNVGQRRATLTNLRLRGRDRDDGTAMPIEPGAVATLDSQESTELEVRFGEVLAWNSQDPYREVRALITAGSGETFESSLGPLIRPK